MFFDRPESGETAILVHIDFPGPNANDNPRELEELALSAGADPVEYLFGTRSEPSSKFFLGKGKVEELAELVRLHDAKLVIFDHSLTPGQERNIEREIECRVLDRTGLILDIFAQRARTHEGKLQVELAQLEHMSTRLIRGWTHLERQKGGIGLRGPGETQLETDRRLLRARIKAITGRLEKVRKQREQGRRARARAEIPTLSLVGYTNAGKSTLFNRITEADVYAADQLFATLDPTLRKLELSDIGSVILADTVGFIRDLPHKLVESFRATLQETVEATLLLHVIDAVDEERREHIAQVNNVLHEIGADEVPTLEVYNKIDGLEGVEPRIDRDDQGVPVRVWLSARTGVGTDLLVQALRERLANDMFHEIVELDHNQGQFRAMLFAQNAVVDEQFTDDGRIRLEVRLQEKELRKILSRLDIPHERYLPAEEEQW
ncbi:MULTISPECIES: ribosome rescue GTPase HflX [unclassified Marinobacterium]|uniref:ribosome rescue GTPase HflX n=1 Tax=unclassified Marinobacterium TaxID=2644139 RepID=UPI001569B8C1|nr:MULTISPECIES: ribosome rescue GTPase HflX [unclassified Marinobacterium]NRP09669.1 GTPase HflX [Marinobacterium sp. xm-g-48]NRP46467.1 GTPase HflX [Marinobacterium sp. xm-d-543]NRP81799.1 GTPase HflX [Marinobacterium sp. xm-d-509]NRQ02919.1 GTPase HflX [Marinobacterium sp. xm-d-530]NRQ22816.1 GTPase HflX [Marinobacterium sp. xm-m-312]